VGGIAQGFLSRPRENVFGPVSRSSAIIDAVQAMNSESFCKQVATLPDAAPTQPAEFANAILLA
jgi:hypothetical protein